MRNAGPAVAVLGLAAGQVGDGEVAAFAADLQGDGLLGLGLDGVQHYRFGDLVAVADAGGGGLRPGGQSLYDPRAGGQRGAVEAVNDRTKLVSISAVSTTNGFAHDLKAVCDLAHAHGAYVYVDMVHAAGITPIDLRAAGVDFAAASSYKWLMGDFGLGFLYVRKEIQDRVKRPWWGYHQLNAFKSHVFPFDEPGPGAATYGMSPDAAGKFAMGTTSWTGVVQLDHSLGFINDLGVPAIQAARQPLIKAVQTELRGRGYQPMTPLDSQTALVAFALKDARAKLGDLMKAANIRLTVSQNRFRVSLAVFNDMNDVDRLLSALPRTPPA